MNAHAEMIVRVAKVTRDHVATEVAPSAVADLAAAAHPAEMTTSLAPKVNYEPLPPPPAPPVPEGPYTEAFEVLGFSPAVLAAIRDFGYTQPTEIQTKAAPIVLAGKDIVGASQTGTGKTAAFGMPALSRLGAPGKLRCLIL